MRGGRVGHELPQPATAWWRALAPLFHRCLETRQPPARIKKALSVAGFRPDYVEERWGRRFGAVKLGKVRLIDNVKIKR